MTSVEWRPVVGWEGFYEVSNTGRVRSVERTLLLRNGVTQVFKSRESKRTPQRDGYLTAHLRDTARGRRSVYRIHRLVAEAFIPNPDGKPYVNHIDCSPANNQVQNLEWCTQGENLAHARRLGRMENNYWKGKRGPNAGRKFSHV